MNEVSPLRFPAAGRPGPQRAAVRPSNGGGTGRSANPAACFQPKVAPSPVQVPHQRVVVRITGRRPMRRLTSSLNDVIQPTVAASLRPWHFRFRS